MKTKCIILVHLACAVVLLLSACSPKPLELANAWQAALNQGDIEAALGYLAEDATISIIPPGSDDDGVYNGRAEVRSWYESIISAKGTGTLVDCQQDGETLTCNMTYTDEGLQSIGVDFLDGTWVAVIRDGKIKSYSATVSDESLAKFPPPPELPPEPEVRITAMEAIIGIWVGKYGEYDVFHDFRSDGSLYVSLRSEGLISRSKYWFEEDLLNIEDFEGGDCSGKVGSYEIYATYNDGKPVLLRMVLVGDDLCETRRKTLAGKTLLPGK